MEVPRLGVESELQQPVYTTATAMLDPGRVNTVMYTNGTKLVYTSFVTYTTAHGNNGSLTY